MKKIFTTILVITLMMLCFAGCSKDEVKEDAQNDIEIEETSDIEETEAEATILTLEELTDEQLDLFRITAEGNVYDIVDGIRTVEEVEKTQEDALEIYIKMGTLPDNAQKLFGEWKESVNYYELLSDWLLDKGVMEEAEAVRPVLPEEEVEDKIESKPIVQNQNKPKPTEKQEQTQHKEITQKPVTPSNNTPSDGEVVGTPGEVITPNGGGSTITEAEEVMGSFEDSIIRAVMATYGVSREEAQKMIASGDI